MNLPNTKIEKLDRMREIVNAVNYTSTDTALIQELIALANHPDFTGMDVRRERLQNCLERLAAVKQTAAQKRWWGKIHEIVGEFPAEISLASSTGSSGGIGYQ